MFRLLISKYLPVYLIISILLTACFNQQNDNSKVLKKRFAEIDSLIIAGKSDSAILLLNKLRPKIKNTDPLICTYYNFQAQHNQDNLQLMQIYADSSITFFADTDKAKQYPDAYINALLVEGDISMKKKKFDTALDYYYKSKRLISAAGCEDGTLAGKIANIYYQQKNYRLAAQCLIESYRHLQYCAQFTQQKTFFIRQGQLNNIAIAYQRAGMPDSALYYYNEDVRCIDKAEENPNLGEFYTRSARIVVYDNLGGLYLKTGDLVKAEDYLLKCIAIPNKDVDGVHIPPYLKLAEIYLNTNRYKKAIEMFAKSRALLDKYKKDNPDSEINWNRLYALYLFKQHQPDKAYQYESVYVHLKDSVESSVAQIYRFDVDHELRAIKQQQMLAEIKRQDSVKMIYLIGISIAGMLLLVIIVLINRNLKQSRKNYHIITLQNEQLQTTLAELERANKNYIRIMRVMAHDLRNPLSGMIGLATVLLDEDEFSEDSKHMLQLIETTGVHSIEMINELLKSGLADENEAIAKQNLDLKALLHDSVELLQFKANEKNQQIIFEADDQPVMTEVNHEKIWRVFNNLIVNAIKFSYENGVIKVGIKRNTNDRHILVWVADNGMGIPDKDKDSIFEMFTAAKKNGTNGEQPFGLGLSISKKIIEKHNGRIWFESEAGKGTIFYIELPV
ncbi:hypothetical protein BEL04_13555 [Mucilaginibacter sp. PPCGB 2223]|uniref:tetratricopeptide repeat-containing sensor histidine kinase n=1 Tax=Mucilaginibacter sp. PPCGB 2223 TaxID=1886027 RepID=UPI000825916D|nr:tetratricopeptide repeat-containing sensor histidine kinase [Mucilaginibacter sp. PPCGB 2223]OCX52483.1 hypothetical protein BEL04_13555 [Mucilaginibacter sp. PPCGB 2223]